MAQLHGQENEADYLLFDNVREALLCGADVIDISGGVETDGFKDAVKIHDIIEIIRKEQK